MKEKNKVIKNNKFNIFGKFLIYNIIIIGFIYISFTIDFFELGQIIVFTIGAFPIYSYLFSIKLSEGNIFFDLYIIWAWLIFNIWFYLFIRKKKGERNKETIVFVLYIILIILLWFLTFIAGGGIFGL